MENGSSSKILKTLREVEANLDFEIHFQISTKRIEPLVHFNAHRAYRGWQTRSENDGRSLGPHLFIYLNIEKKHFVWIGSHDLEQTQSIRRSKGAKFWDDLSRLFSQDLRSTHYENAVCLFLRTIQNSLTIS